MDEILTYTGEALKRPFKKNGLELDAYIPENTLIEAVNLAILLHRPLLLMGDPGCGKTRLAESVAFEFYGEDFKEYFFRWDIKSTTKAREGLYRYDSIGRLRDAQLDGERSKDPANYISLAEMGEAFLKSTVQKRAILLIDEIDKADIDFPNDLLLELDKHQFKIDETGEVIHAAHPPIIFITSNGEKELPAAFLRRCLYHHISFPDKNDLVTIVKVNFDSLENSIIEQAVELFRSVRKEMEMKFSNAEKKVSTSELLDWFRVITYYDSLKKTNKKLSGIESKFVQQLELLNSKKIPFRQVLLKNFESHLNIMPDGSKG